jgi:lipopolysaccharide biosynthesis glycosyltransferase
MEHNYVYTTLVMLGDKYVAGAAALARSIRDSGSKIPIWCMIDDNVSVEAKEFLKTQFDNVVNVPLIEKETIPMKSVKQMDIYGGWISKSFTKGHIFNPTLFSVNGKAFDKVLFVDADMIIKQNIDEVFNLSTPAATFSSPWAKPYVRGGIYNPYGDMKHGNIVPRYKLEKGFSSILGIGSLILVEPTDLTWKIFNEILNRGKVYGFRGCISGFDEQIIAEVMMSYNRVYHIHQKYNWFVGKHTWLLDGDTPLTYHYYGTVKPWQQKRGVWDDDKCWWDVADKIVAEYPHFANWLYSE